MYAGPLSAATVYSTWAESLEVWDVETDTPMDFTDVTEIKLILRDPTSRFDEVTLLMSTGGITIPDDGVIEWRVEASQMSQLNPKMYTVILLISDADNTVPLMLGSIAVVE